MTAGSRIEEFRNVILHYVTSLIKLEQCANIPEPKWNRRITMTRRIFPPDSEK